MQPKWRLNSISHLFWPRGILGIAGIALAVAGLYGMSRPCVLGPCPLVERQQPDDDVTNRVADLLVPTATPDDVVRAYDLLLKHVVDLSRIPMWSAHYAAAQDRLQIYTDRADTVAKLLSAQRSGREAAIASQNAPHPVDTWQGIEQHWRDAITDLNQVGSDGLGFQVAQHKLQEYQQNQAAIAQRIALEQQAQSKISAARDAATLAETRTRLALTPEDWQHVHITWQVVFDRLDAVNPYTMAYAEAQQLAALYRPHIEVAQKRQQQEQQSVTAYQQANQLSQQAQAFEAQGQWSLATGRWQTALERLGQVPTDTIYYDQAQPLTHAYAKSLERSQQGLQIATAIQTFRDKLDRACQQAQLCDYVAASNAVHVRVADMHRQAVAQAISLGQPASAAVTPPEPSTSTAVSQLLQVMASLGSATQVPVEFYDGAGLLIGTYKPDRSRYVASEAIQLAESPPEWVAVQTR